MSQNVSTVTSSFAAASLGESSESNVGINSSFASSQSSHIKSSAWSNVPQPNLPPPPSSSSSQHHHHPHQSPWNRHPLQLNEQYHQQASSEASVSSDTHHHHHHPPPPHRVSGDIRNRVSGDIRQQAGYDTRRSRGRAPPPHHHHHHHARSSRERDHNVEKELFGDPDSIQTGINFKKYDDIPVEVSGSNIPDGVSSFHDIQLHPVLQRNVTLCRYTHPTPVQKHALPVGMAARDLMACAQTGSGKTAAFLLPALHRVLSGNLKNTARMTKYQSGNGQRRITRRRSTPSILVLAPTRELAAQIYTEARKFCYCSPLNAVVVYGGQDAIVQLRELELGCDVLVATPGRLCDFIERGRISLANISVLVFDEADRMLDMGFEPQIRRIVEEEDLRSNHQTLMFSATFPAQIQQLAQDYLNDYVFLAVGRVGSTTDSISQCIEYAADRDKKRMLLRILPQCEGLTLIFVDTKRMADSLEDWLINQGVNTTSIHGDRSQDEREYSLLEFREGRCPVLVATDVASRGLDIPNVLHVINFDFPSQIDDYVHRIGRTGRCGNTGTATSFINERNQAVLIPLYDMLKENNQVVPAFLEQMMASKDFGSNGNRHNGARRSGRRNNSRYSARDARRGHTETFDTRPHHNTNTQWNEQSESSQQKDNSKRRSQKSKPKNNRGNNQSSQSAPADNWGNSHSMRTGNRGGSTDAW